MKHRRYYVKLGSAIPITGNAFGGKAPYRYAFYFKRDTNTNWKFPGTKFSTENTARLKPSSKGTYDVKVIVKDSNGNTSEKLFKALVK